MTAVRAPRWALSFADLCLVLLGFFIMLHAQSGHQAQLLKGLHSSFSGVGQRADAEQDLEADKLFEPQEAVLKPAARAQLEGIGHAAVQTHARVHIESTGVDKSTSRFDAWELAAARTAAIGRVLRSAGVAEDRIDISIPDMRSGTPGDHQRITIVAYAS